MKKTMIAFVTVLLLATGYEAKCQINSSISFNTFYNELSPYGRWVDYPQYGQVWISNENGFEPYSSNGHWQFTNYGWMWASDYNWGWAPFHYGRWTYLNNYGWAWVPGYEWAPAWVGWCNYDGYYGWAPLSPGIGFNYNFNSMPLNHWRFVRQQYINDPYVYRHYQRPVRNVNQYQNITVINNTVVNNNVTYVSGPSKAQVETVIKKKIEPKQVAFSNEGVKKTELVNKNEVRVFRPDVKTATVKQQPAKIIMDEKTGAAMVNPAVVKKQVLIKDQPQPVKQPQVIRQPQADSEIQPVQKNNIRKQPIQKATDEQLFEIKKQQQEQAVIKKQAQQNEAAQQAIINQQQQDAAKQQQEQVRAQQQQSDAKQQEVIRRQQQQELIRAQQQQNEVKQQEAIRRQQQQEAARQQQQLRQEKQQRQEEMRQQKMQQQPQQPARQQENILPKQTNERPPQQPAKQNRKNNSPF